ncbi:MAG: amidohydrolase/deacetylase family metallohydrolase [Terriglobia bacterium]
MVTRRQFSRYLAGAGTGLSVLNGGFALGSPDEPGALEVALGDPRADCDIVIKGGTVIDPGQKLHAPLDVAVRNGKILEVSKDIPSSRGRKVITAKGKIVTPGLIDIHAHVFEAIGQGGVSADRTCLTKGVTTVVDAGSAGYSLIPGLRKYVIDASSTRIRALVDVGALGLVVGIDNAMQNLDWVDPVLAARAAQSNKPAVVGIKVRLQESIQGAKDIVCLKRAIEAAETCQMPLMVHIQGPHSPLDGILSLMRKGDVLTHCYNGGKHGVLDQNGKVLPSVWHAQKRGIIFDAAHGFHHLNFNVAEKCLQQGFIADTLSTDLTLHVIHGPVYDLPTTLSKFMALGMTLDQVIERATSKAVHVFDLGVDVGALRPGAEADIAIFELRHGKFEFMDNYRQVRTGRQKLVPLLTCSGRLFQSDWLLD